MRYLIALLSCFLVPLLPERFRKMWPWELPVSIETLAHISAYMHAVISLVAWFVGLILYQQEAAEMVTAAVADERGSGEVGTLTWYGMVTFWAFFFTPQGILLTAYILDSAVRFIHAAASGAPMGSVFLSAPLYFVGKLVDLTQEAKRTALYGNAAEPDRITPVGDGLILRANRPHRDWNTVLTYEYGEKFFKLDSFGEGVEGGKKSHEYRFRPWPDRVMIRAVVRLDGVEVPGSK